MKGKLLCIGKGGHTVHFPRRKEGSISYGQSTMSGYITDADKAAQDVASDLRIGAVVIDKIPAIDEGDGVKMAIQGPMVDVDLADEETDRCPEPNPFMAVAMAGSEFGTLLTLQGMHRASSAAPGPLDHVSVKVYAQLWKEAGARIGRWNGSAIEWQS